MTKIPEKINLKEEKAYLGSCFQRFQSVVCCFGAYGRQHSTSWQGGCGGKVRGRNQGPNISFKGTSPVT
jgi:hypothetical protein